MALFDVELEVDYLDAAERTATISYMLREQYDDAANAGDGNFADIWTAVQAVQVALNVLTMAAIPVTRISVIDPDGGTPNVASNNQVRAFSRILDDNGDKSSIEVASWDDVVFDENNQNVLSDAYDTAVAALALLLRAPETGENFALGPEYSQSRTRKSRNIIND